jgi:hypothetical protein
MLSTKSNGEGCIDSAWEQVDIGVPAFSVGGLKEVLNLAKLQLELLESELSCLDLCVSVRVDERRVQGGQSRHRSCGEGLSEEDNTKELIVCGHGLLDEVGRDVLAIKGEIQSVQSFFELSEPRQEFSEASDSHGHVAVRLGL